MAKKDDQIPLIEEKPESNLFGDCLNVLLGKDANLRNKLKDKGIDNAKITRWTSGTSSVSDDELFLISEITGINPIELRFGKRAAYKYAESVITKDSIELISQYRSSSAILECILRIIDNEVYVIKKGNGFVMASETALKHLGHSKSSIKKANPYKVFPSIADSFKEMVDDKLEEHGDTTNLHSEHMRDDGYSYFVNCTLELVKTKNDGEFFIGIGRHIDGLPKEIKVKE